METTISTEQVSNNLQNLTDEERQLITQLNIPQFRNFMSKVFGADFGSIMQEAIPAPQVAPEPQPVSPQSETPAPMEGQGIMTQPPSR
jgi:hypothetical protein